MQCIVLKSPHIWPNLAGCGSCRGCRNEGVNGVANWCGARERKSLISRCLHPDAESMVQETIDSSVCKWVTNEPITVVSEVDVADDMEIQEL
eukprot:15366491-Ditylum_brightwellii.AAC.1